MTDTANPQNPAPPLPVQAGSSLTWRGFWEGLSKAFFDKLAAGVVGGLVVILGVTFWIGRNYDSIIQIPNLPNLVNGAIQTIDRVEIENQSLKKAVADLTQRLEKAQAAIDSVQGRISSLDSTAERTTVSGDLVVSANKFGGPETAVGARRTSEARCPEGQYAAGVATVDDDEGGYCVECISTVKIFCRPL